MKATVKKIKVPNIWISKSDWDSHREALYLALINYGEAVEVVEFGVGIGSTHLLRKYCDENGIRFQSYETDREYCDRFSAWLRPDYISIDVYCDILFVDGKPGEERKEVIKKNANLANVIIAHDTEPGANYVYGMADVLSTFKYRLDYQPEGKPHTTIVSNVINVSEWANHQNSISSTIQEG